MQSINQDGLAQSISHQTHAAYSLSRVHIFVMHEEGLQSSTSKIQKVAKKLIG